MKPDETFSFSATGIAKWQNSKIIWNTDFYMGSDRHCSALHPGDVASNNFLLNLI